MQSHEVDDGRTIERESLLRAPGGDQRDSRNGDLKGHQRRVGRKSVSNHGEAYGTGAATIGNAYGPGFGSAAGSQRQGGEQKNRKKRQSLTAIHVAPHDSIACVCHPGKGKRGHPH